MASLTEITGELGRKRAAHLLRRATFGPTIPEIDQFAALTATQALALLLDDTAVNPLPPIDLLTGSTWLRMDLKSIRPSPFHRMTEAIPFLSSSLQIHHPAQAVIPRRHFLQLRIQLSKRSLL